EFLIEKGPHFITKGSFFGFHCQIHGSHLLRLRRGALASFDRSLAHKSEDTKEAVSTLPFRLSALASNR
ncbi:MAG TPA: hypothetical protein DD437_11015, partial [Rhodobiaceae bacterium]|nr:hypothetical protein [Rhodobiaceae bacterium]